MSKIKLANGISNPPQSTTTYPNVSYLSAAGTVQVGNIYQLYGMVDPTAKGVVTPAPLYARSTTPSGAAVSHPVFARNIGHPVHIPIANGDALPTAVRQSTAPIRDPLALSGGSKVKVIRPSTTVRGLFGQ
jgi:hypothetical protein